jgi:hypothetical protein
VAKVIITGTNLVAVTGQRPVVAISGDDIAVGPVNIIDGTQLSATLTISSTAAVGIRSVTVRNSAGTSNNADFTILPVLQNVSLTPSAVVAGQPSILALTVGSEVPVNGAMATLSSSDVHVAVPPAVTIPGGLTTATFIATTSSFPGGITDPISVTITATLGGISATGSLRVLPATTVITSSTKPFNIAPLGAVSVLTTGTSTTAAAGYAVIQPTTGSITPSGIAIFGVQQNGILVSETSVPLSPPVTSGRIYAEINGAVNTGFAIANPGRVPAAVQFFFTDALGNTLGSGSVLLEATFRFGPSHLAAFLDQYPYNLSAPFQGTFSFVSTVPIAVVGLRGVTNERGEFLMSSLPVVDTTAPPTGVQVLPDYADGAGWVTEILLVNPTNTTLTGTLQFSNPTGSASNVTIAGQSGSSFSYSVPALSSQKLVTSGAGATTAGGSIRVVPAGTIAPMPFAVFSYMHGGITVSEAVVSPRSGTALRMYVESAGLPGQSGNIQSGVTIANNSSSPATVTFQVSGMDGSAGSKPASIDLPGAGQTAKFLSDLFPSLPSVFAGILHISTTAAGVSVAGLRTRYNERGDFLITTTPVITEDSATVVTTPPIQPVFPQFVDGGGYTTDFILLGGPGQSASGMLNLYDTNGRPLNIGLK